MRRAQDGALEVLLVHRPAYDDWTLPKGKADPGEADEACALREVLEETGLACVLGRELEAVEYVDRRGRPKRVRYWAMSLAPGTETAPPRQPDDEVDELRWLPLARADALASYPHDKRLIRSLA